MSLLHKEQTRNGKAKKKVTTEEPEKNVQAKVRREKLRVVPEKLSVCDGGLNRVFVAAKINALSFDVRYAGASAVGLDRIGMDDAEIVFSFDVESNKSPTMTFHLSYEKAIALGEHLLRAAEDAKGEAGDLGRSFSRVGGHCVIENCRFSPGQ